MAVAPYRRRRTVNPDFSTSNPEDMARQDRQVGINYSDIFNDDFSDDEVEFGNIANQHRGQADELYEQLLNNPGLTPEEREQILGQIEGRATEQDLQGNFQTEDEWMANQGNPWDRNRAFDPGQMEERTREAQGWRRGAFDRGAKGVREGLDRGEGSLRGALDRGDSTADAALDRNESDVRGSIGRVRDGVSSDLDRFEKGLTDNARGVQDKLDGIVNDPDLEVGDEEIQRAEDRAGRTIGNAYQSGLNEAESAANRAGTTNPLAMAELKGRVRRESAGKMADAVSDATLGGIRLQREVRGQNADRKVGAADIGAGYGERASTTIGRTRADTGLALGELETGAEVTLGRNRQGSILDRNNLRVGAENSMAGRRAGAEADIMGLGVDVEDANANDQRDMTQWNQQMGVDIGRDVDDTQVERSRWNTVNRQATNNANLNTRFNQGHAQAQHTQQGGTIATNARRNDQQTVRDYHTNQGQFHTQQRGAAAGRRVQGVGVGLGHASDGTRTFSNFRTNNPTLGRRWVDGMISGAQQGARAAAGGA